MTPSSRRQLGHDIARLVVDAEKKFPARGAGRLKMAYCVREARKRAPKEKNSSADAAKWFGAMVLRIGIEIAVASIALYRKEQGL
jgi:hypothetical protein